MPSDSARARVDRRRLALILQGAALAVVIAALIGGLIATLGLYSVAASKGHLVIVERLLHFGMQRSVKAHAPDIDPPPLDDIHRIRLGAAHFHTGCAYCHGAPDRRINPISARMLPPPPDLSGEVGKWTDQELFWIVQNGIKYAGMPAWPAEQRDDEIWSVVAFLRRLPALDSETYRELAVGEMASRPSNARAARDEVTDPISDCARCHGVERAPMSRHVPFLHGQTEDAILKALQAYAQGERASGVMQPIASDLSSDDMRRLAARYAKLGSPRAARPPQVETERWREGRRLATEGDPPSGAPACDACHGRDALTIYPRLQGQHAPYLEAQLFTWRKGLNGATPTGAIMAPIAMRLTPRQISDVTTYYESLSGDAGRAGAE